MPVAHPLRSGKKDVPAERAIGPREAQEITRACRKRLGEPRRLHQSILRHFSHYDQAVSELPPITPEEACAQAIVYLGQIQSSNWRGIRPQLARLVLLIARAARQDGYNLRVAAETSLSYIPPQP